jgi:DNA-binding transcriptional ArsR family regulator
MTVRKNGCSLRFPCECVSNQGGYSDPWAGVTQNKLLSDGTKERVLNAVARRPKTIAHLAKELGLSAPTVHAHVNDLLKSELLRASAGREKRHPAENYYEPGFPVIKSVDSVAFDPICEAMAERLADLFEARQVQLRSALEKTGLADEGWQFPDVAQYLFACVQRGARERLEERGVLPRRERHENGTEWTFWAEEEPAASVKR